MCNLYGCLRASVKFLYIFILIEIVRAFDVCVPSALACVGSFIFVILGMYVQGHIYI